MLRTEEKARKCWCPNSRAVAHNGCNRPFGSSANDSWCRCIASDCMAWRWERHQEVGKEVRGYCGAFGEPEA